MKRFKIAVCLPTYQEADTVVRAAKVIDQGLQFFKATADLYIVNADNNSADNTAQVFLNTPTIARKVSIINRNKGKGFNLLSFFKWCHKNNIDAAATIDSDVSSSKTNWMDKIISPILSGRADYVVPGYRRDKFDASITNHLAFPLVYAHFGKQLRQPIGGEFGFNKRLISYFLKQAVILETGQFGIDIFMTSHALGMNAKILEVPLGKKIHKPSFPKISHMFLEVFSSGFQSIQKYKIHQKARRDSMSIGINTGKKFKHNKEAQDLFTYAQEQFKVHEKFYSKHIPLNLVEEIRHGRVGALEWAQFFSHVYKIIKKSQFNLRVIRQWAKASVPIYIFRTIEFWQTVEYLPPTKIENLIIDQAQAIRTAILSKKTL